MERQNSNYGTRSLIGGILIIIGGLFLLRSMSIIDYDIPYIIFSGPFVLFVVGLLILINSRKRLLGGLFMFIGALLLLERIFPQFEVNGEIVVSIIVIGLGLLIIFRHGGKKHWPDPEKMSRFYSRHETDYTSRKDYIDDVAIFGGGQRNVLSDNFKGGSITAIFGGTEINLSNCKMAEGTNVIDVVAIFGGAEIRVPRDWDVISNITPVFGGFANKIVRDPNLPVDTTRTLIIKGIALFGGVEVNTKQR